MESKIRYFENDANIRFECKSIDSTGSKNTKFSENLFKNSVNIRIELKPIDPISSKNKKFSENFGQGLPYGQAVNQMP